MSAQILSIEPSAELNKIKELEKKISERFEVLEILTDACLTGKARSLIVSGPPGLGKSYTVEQMVRTWDPTETKFTINKGYSTPVGLYRLLYKHRHPYNVLVLDDTDSVFFDDKALNLLKTVCDTTKDRHVSWRTNAELWTEDYSEKLPKTFLFEGAMIFLTNLDLEYGKLASSKLSKHFQALISRSHYIDLALKTRADYLIRIFQVYKQGTLLSNLPEEQRKEVMRFINNNHTILRELSVRMAVKLGDLRASRAQDWEKIARITCCK